MKKFSIPCDFNGQKAPFTIYIGMPKDDHHPLHFQADWLTKVRGGTIPQEIMDSLSRLKDISVKNGVAFEDLCVYALGAAQQEASAASDNAEELESSSDETKISEHPDEQLEEKPVEDDTKPNN